MPVNTKKIYYFISLVFLTLQIYTYPKRPFTLMLDPAGNAKHAGREIDDCFERGITLQCAEYLKKSLEVTYPGIRVILTRFPGESLEPLQNANFSNRLDVDFYLSIHFYFEQEEKPKLFLYQFVYNATTDFWKQAYDLLSFIPYDQAHRQIAEQTRTYTQQIKRTLEQFHRQFELVGYFTIPFKPLIGITAPAIGIEVSLKNKYDWQQYIQPIVKSFGSILRGNI